MREKASVKEQCSDIYKFVHARVSKLQRMYLSDTGKGQAARQLATLRHAATKKPGSDADLWLVEFDEMPQSLVGYGCDPSEGERAIHIALTLYAAHQQSQSQEMHRPGAEFDIGAAMRRFTYSKKGAEGLKDEELPRRFSAMTSADSIDELAHHARQLIHLFRASALPIDYGRFARQLFSFQIPYLRDGVRLEWGRAYARPEPLEDKKA